MTILTLRCVGAWLCLGCAASPHASESPRPSAPPEPAAVAAEPVPPAPAATHAPPATSAPEEASAPDSTASLPARDRVVLTTYFEFLGRDGTRRPLVSGSSLKSGDRFALLVSVRERLYVYVLYAGPDGSAAVLYPERGDMTLEPGPAHRFPADRDFELDAVPGWERLLVVASRQPLSKSEDSLAAFVASVRESQEWPQAAEPSARKAAARTSPATKRPPPTPAPVADHGPAWEPEGRTAGADYRGVTRGVHLTAAGSGRIDAIPDARGVVAIPLFIRHLP